MSHSHYSFHDRNLTDAERVTKLLELMTLEEKIDAFASTIAVPRLGISGTGLGEGLHGVARGGPSEWGGRHPVTTTIFPQAVGLGQTWNPALVQKVAEVQSHEIRYISQSGRHGPSQLVVLAPNADVARDPRWGRIEESYGEDAFFVGCFTAAFTRGLQGDHPRYWRSASLLKHFFANTTENDRAATSSDFSQRWLHEYYTVGFRESARAGARCLMAAYNAVNGVPMTQSPLLRTLAHDEFGMDGIFCSDGGGMHQTVDSGHHYNTYAEATAAAVQAGINVFLESYQQPLRDALAGGRLVEGDLDQALRGSLLTLLRLGLLDSDDEAARENPYHDLGRRPSVEPWNTPEHRALALEVTRQSIVLLKNDHQLLPLDVNRGQKIVVIGEWANQVLFDWYSGTPPYAVTPLQGIREHIAQHSQSELETRGTAQNLVGAPQWVVDRERQANRGVVVWHNGRDQEAAADLARLADVAIVVVGNHPWGNGLWAQVTHNSYGREAVDRESIFLEEESLIKKVRWANQDTIVVLQSSFPYAINWTQANVSSIVQITHSSQETGTALAEVLFGVTNPAGRTVHTWPRSPEQLVPMADYDLAHGRTYQYFKGEPLYPFGHGLSYTQFRYSEAALSTAKWTGPQPLVLTLEVDNVGDRDGDEVVQVYASFPRSSVARPQLQLVAFQRIAVASGQRQRVSFELDPQRFAVWDESREAWNLDSGTVELHVGPSSGVFHQHLKLEIGAKT